MRNYKEMDWDELEDCADKIRNEIDNIETEINLWESRDVEGMPSPDFYQRIESLKDQLSAIAEYQNILEGE